MHDSDGGPVHIEASHQPMYSFARPLSLVRSLPLVIVAQPVELGPDARPFSDPRVPLRLSARPRKVSRALSICKLGVSKL